MVQEVPIRRRGDLARWEISTINASCLPELPATIVRFLEAQHRFSPKFMTML